MEGSAVYVDKIFLFLLTSDGNICYVDFLENIFYNLMKTPTAAVSPSSPLTTVSYLSHSLPVPQVLISSEYTWSYFFEVTPWYTRKACAVVSFLKFILVSI